MTGLVVSLLLIFTGLPPTTFEARVETHVNTRRVNHNLSPLSHGPCLQRVATEWARHIASTGTAYHRTSSQIWDRCGGVAVGEVIARGSLSPWRTVRAWMWSPTHRRVLLGDYDRIGVGAVRDADGRWVVVANVKRVP